MIVLPKQFVALGKCQEWKSPPFAVSNQARSLRLNLERLVLPKRTNLYRQDSEVCFQISRDGGWTWKDAGGSTTPNSRSWTRIGLCKDVFRLGRVVLRSMSGFVGKIDVANSITIGTPNSGEGSNVTTLTVSITVSGSNTYLAAYLTYVGSDTFTSVKYAGVTMDSKWTQLGTFHSSVYARGFSLKAPAAGANNLVASWDTSHNGWLGGIPMAEVDQTTPDDTAATATGTTTTATVNDSSSTGNVVWDGVCVFNWSSMASTNTQQWEIYNAGEGVNSAQSTANGAATVTMSYTKTAGPSNFWGIGAVSVNAAAAAGPTLNLLSLTGVGA